MDHQRGEKVGVPEICGGGFFILGRRELPPHVLMKWNFEENHAVSEIWDMDLVNECFCKQVNHTVKRYATSFNVVYKHVLFRSQFPLLTYDTYGSKKYFLVVGLIREGRCIPPWLMLVLVLPANWPYHIQGGATQVAGYHCVELL